MHHFPFPPSPFNFKAKTTMSTTTNHHHHHHQRKIGSFTPTWCLRPPTMTPRYTTTTTTTKTSPLPSSRRAPKKPSNRHSRNNSSEASSIEPTSPRVGCTGQISRPRKPPSRSNSSVHLSRSVGSPQFNMFMLKKTSGASSTGSTASPSPARSSSSTVSPLVITGEFSLLVLKRVSSTRVSYEEMDPPRPVEKEAAKPKESVSLWKRRCAGGGGLQVNV